MLNSPTNNATKTVENLSEKEKEILREHDKEMMLSYNNMLKSISSFNEKYRHCVFDTTFISRNECGYFEIKLKFNLLGAVKQLFGKTV